jgi:hypothetical protein
VVLLCVSAALAAGGWLTLSPTGEKEAPVAQRSSTTHLRSVGRRRASHKLATPTTQPRHAAEVVAAESLKGLHLPVGATRVKRDPSVGARLHWPAVRLATPRLVDDVQFWRVPGSPRAVLRGIANTPPAGSHIGWATPASLTFGVQIYGPYTAFTLRPLPAAGVTWREVSVLVSHATGGGTAVRIDSEAAWRA